MTRRKVVSFWARKEIKKKKITMKTRDGKTKTFYVSRPKGYRFKIINAQNPTLASKPK